MIWIGIILGIFLIWCIGATIFEVIKENGYMYFIKAVITGAVIIGTVYLFVSSSDATGSEDTCMARDAYGCIE